MGTNIAIDLAGLGQSFAPSPVIQHSLAVNGLQKAKLFDAEAILILQTAFEAYQKPVFIEESA